VLTGRLAFWKSLPKMASHEMDDDKVREEREMQREQSLAHVIIGNEQASVSYKKFFDNVNEKLEERGFSRRRYV
jgi:hypothetical protein